MSTKKFTIAASSQVVRADTLANFMASQLEEDLETVPGVGPKAKEKLEEGGIPTTHALIGLFLTLREKGMSVVTHCDAFHTMLADKFDIKHYRSAITRAIAEKVNTFIPGSFDEGAFDE